MIEIPLDAIPLRKRKKRTPAIVEPAPRQGLRLEMAQCLANAMREIIGKERAARHTMNAG